MADDETKGTAEDEATTEAGTEAGTPDTDAGAKADPDEGTTDKHGEPAINRGRYDRDIAKRDRRIKELEAQLEESGKAAKAGEDAIKRVDELEARLADEKVSNALTAAGCVDQKAAKARLDDFDGDVSKLKAECPYLFRSKPGSTGAKPAGVPDDADEKLDRAFGLKK